MEGGGTPPCYNEIKKPSAYRVKSITLISMYHFKPLVSLQVFPFQIGRLLEGGVLKRKYGNWNTPSIPSSSIFAFKRVVYKRTGTKLQQIMLH